MAEQVLTEEELQLLLRGRREGYERGYKAGVQAEKRRRSKVEKAKREKAK